jgi:hypothetical protein
LLAFVTIALLWLTGFLSHSAKYPWWLQLVTDAVGLAGGYCIAILTIRADRWDRLNRDRRVYDFYSLEIKAPPLFLNGEKNN